MNLNQLMSLSVTQILEMGGREVRSPVFPDTVLHGQEESYREYRCRELIKSAKQSKRLGGYFRRWSEDDWRSGKVRESANNCYHFLSWHVNGTNRDKTHILELLQLLPNEGGIPNAEMRVRESDLVLGLMVDGQKRYFSLPKKLLTS